MSTDARGQREVRGRSDDTPPGWTTNPSLWRQRLPIIGLAALSFVAIWSVARALRWATLPIGLYLIVVPWILGFPTDAAISNLAAGVIFVVTAFIRGGVSERYGGGWMSLRHPCPGVDLPTRS